jgi:hypothetical protein
MPPVALGDPEIVTIDQLEGRAMDSDHAFGSGLFDTPEEMIHWIYETYAIAESARADTGGA